MAAPRVAIIGAGGIGKHHAKWWALEGADVCAFSGTSIESTARAREGLTALFDFRGNAYTSVEEMIEKEQPEYVDVCSPPALHHKHVLAALEAGCHVLCEKPFVFEAGVVREELLESARQLVDLANSSNLRLVVSTQYSAAGPVMENIWRASKDNEPLLHFVGRLESPAKNRPPDPVRIWVDLSPHPISVMLKALPGGKVLWETLSKSFCGYEAIAEMQVESMDGRRVVCRIITRNTMQPPSNVRHFEFNDYPISIEGQNDEQGIYCARFETPDGNHIHPDMMRLAIRAFGKGQPCVDSAESLANLDIMLRILES